MGHRGLEGFWPSFSYSLDALLKGSKVVIFWASGGANPRNGNASIFFTLKIHLLRYFRRLRRVLSIY